MSVVLLSLLCLYTSSNSIFAYIFLFFFSSCLVDSSLFLSDKSFSVLFKFLSLIFCSSLSFFFLFFLVFWTSNSKLLLLFSSNTFPSLTSLNCSCSSFLFASLCCASSKPFSQSKISTHYWLPFENSS